MRALILLPYLAAAGCLLHPQNSLNVPEPPITGASTRTTFEENSWQYFLQNLPTSGGAVLLYTGAPLNNQSKHTALVNYDVGTKDLQQCADALIRLRAEYLFQQKRYPDIKFHFTSGDLYRYTDYLNGLRPLVSGNKVRFQNTAATEISHSSLRKYLDLVYAYAGTISLAKELQSARKLTVGTVIIKPGSPGHCSIIVDEATNAEGQKVYKLAEGYSPAQSIYILKNPMDGSPWYPLQSGKPISTSSYSFPTYQLVQFE